MKYYYHTDDTYTHRNYPAEQRKGCMVEALGRAMQDSPANAVFVFEKGYITCYVEDTTNQIEDTQPTDSNNRDFPELVGVY